MMSSNGYFLVCFSTYCYILVFLTLYEVLIKISKVLQKIINATIILIIPSKILGGLVSLVKGYLILFIVFLLLMIPIGNSEIYKESTMVHYMVYETPVLAGYTSNFTRPIEKVYSLSEKLSKNQISKIKKHWKLC